MSLLRLAIVTLFAFPALVLAAPPSTSPYHTDVANSYVYDKVTEDMFILNGFLCLMSAMAPDKMVNAGDYIALIDPNSCFKGGSGGQSSNKGKEYFPVQVNSSRTSNGTPMQVKMWFDAFDASVPLYSTATQPPSRTLPNGIFRMDGCVKLSADASCDGKVGYIDASKSGLGFYFLMSDNNGDFNELALQLSASSTSNTGNGILVTNEMNSSVLTTTATLFAYNPDYFYRSDGTINSCFNRALNYAQESAWRYGLYDLTTGEHLVHKTGFPIEYTYTSANTSGTGTVGTTYNGYISYYGLSMSYGSTSEQVDVPSGETVYQISYDTSPPTKTPYTLLRTGGKLTKYTTITKSLTDLHKLTFWYYAQNNVGTAMVAGSQYELYWDNSTAQFMVSGKQGTSGNMETYPAPVPIDTTAALSNAAMAAANPWGLSGWSQMLGGQFTIKASDFANLASNTSATPVFTQTQDVVYPKDFQAINNAGGLRCIGGCPTASELANNTYAGSVWGWFNSLDNYTYTLDPSTGNMLDATNAPVIKTTAGAIYSGKLVTGTDMAAIQLAKQACTAPCSSQADIDLLPNPAYYVWETSSDYWNQMAFLYVGSDKTNTVTFYPPLLVNFAVPNTAKYGSSAGSTVSLQSGDFGDLWGIPNKCVDLTTNAECVFTGTPTPSANQHWAPKFSIPFSLTDGIVTVAVGQGPIASGTQFLVKALDKEIRLAQVPVNICTALGLTKPVSVTKLPSYAGWIDPRPNIGAKPVLNPVPAPRVIDGVKQY